MSTTVTTLVGRLGSSNDTQRIIHAVGASSGAGVGGRTHHGPGIARHEPHVRRTRFAANPATQIPLEHIEQYSRFRSTPSLIQAQPTDKVELRALPGAFRPRGRAESSNSISSGRSVRIQPPKNISATRSAPILTAERRMAGAITTPPSENSRRLSFTLTQTATRHSDRPGRRLSAASSHASSHSWQGSSGIVASLPTPGLLSSLAGAAHYTGNPRYSKQEAARASFGSKPVVLDDQRKQTVEDVLELFCAHPSLEILDRSWHPDAVFEDPWTKCIGRKEYAAQWFGLPRIVSQSNTIEYRVLSSTHHPHRIVLDQTRQYTLRYIEKKKTVHSLVIIDLDGQGKIIKMEDRWNGEDPPCKWGAMWLRRLNGKVAPLFVRVPRHSPERTPTPV